MKKLGILINPNYTDISAAITTYFISKGVEVCSFGNLAEINPDTFDIILLTDYQKEIPYKLEGKFFNIHPSLLPAFSEKNAILKAYKSGVKISGITIIDPIKNNIIAQYPVFISNLAHFDEFKDEMIKTATELAISVVEALLSGQIFDFKLKKAECVNGQACNGKCGGCKHHETN